MAVHTKAWGLVGCGDVAGDGPFEFIDGQKTPRFRLCRVSREIKPSTALSHKHKVGVKWNVYRGCAASQASTSGCLWAA